MYYYAYLENGICIDIERTRTEKTDLTNYVQVTVNEYNAYMNEETTSEYYIIGMRWNGSEWIVATQYYYAVLNIKNIAVSVVSSLTEINKDNYIPITEEEYTVKNCINCKWNTETEQFDEVPLSVYADADTTKISVNGSEVPLQTLLDAMQTEIDAKGGEVTATDILVALTTVDGSGSGVDSDTLDGHDSAYFARNDDVQAMMIDLDSKASNTDVQAIAAEMETLASAEDMALVATKADLETLKAELLAAISSGTGSVIKSIQRGSTMMAEDKVITFEKAVNPEKTIVLLYGSSRNDEDEYAFCQLPTLDRLTETTITLSLFGYNEELSKAMRISYQIIEFY